MHSCLVLTFEAGTHPLHVVVEMDAPTATEMVTVTVYRPDPNRWLNWRVRR